MTLRELQALLLLYQAASPELRARAPRLVPDLAEWDEAQPAEEQPPVSSPSPRISYDRDVPPPFECPTENEHCGGFWQKVTIGYSDGYFWVKTCSDATCPLNRPVMVTP